MYKSSLRLPDLSDVKGQQPVLHLDFLGVLVVGVDVHLVLVPLDLRLGFDVSNLRAGASLLYPCVHDDTSSGCSHAGPWDTTGTVLQRAMCGILWHLVVRM